MTVSSLPPDWWIGGNAFETMQLCTSELWWLQVAKWKQKHLIEIISHYIAPQYKNHHFDVSTSEYNIEKKHVLKETHPQTYLQVTTQKGQRSSIIHPSIHSLSAKLLTPSTQWPCLEWWKPKDARNPSRWNRNCAPPLVLSLLSQGSHTADGSKIRRSPVDS